jgi:hypothetical protein
MHHRNQVAGSRKTRSTVRRKARTKLSNHCVSSTLRGAPCVPPPKLGKVKQPAGKA